MESSVSQQENPKYFSHKIKFQDVQDRDRYALLIAQAARHSFGTTENCVANNLYKVCKCCKSEMGGGKALGTACVSFSPCPALCSARLPACATVQAPLVAARRHESGKRSCQLSSRHTIGSPSRAVGAYMSLELFRN